MENTEKKWNLSNKEDFDQIVEYFNSQPNYRILEFNGYFWLQMKLPNSQDEYTNLDQSYYYDLIQDKYIKENGYKTLEEAQKAYQLYITKGIIHPIQ